MSDIAKPQSAIAKTDLTPDEISAAIDKPLRLIPAEYRACVWGFWAKWSDLLKTQLALSARIREWVAERGLTLDELQRAFAAVNQPERQSQIRFPGDVLAELATAVAKVIERRESLERAAELRIKQEQWQGSQLTEIRLADLFKAE